MSNAHPIISPTKPVQFKTIAINGMFMDPGTRQQFKKTGVAKANPVHQVGSVSVFPSKLVLSYT